jgi:hypothetical protein
LIVTGVIAAQVTPAHAQSLEVGAAYQYLRLSAGDEDRSFPAGFNVDVTLPFTGRLRFVGEFGWARRSESFEDLFAEVDTVMSIDGGVRWTTGATLRIWVQGTAGVQRSGTAIEFEGSEIGDDTLSDLLLGVDGGVTWPMGRFGVFGAGGYRRVFTDDAGANSLRALAGVRVAFGS